VKEPSGAYTRPDVIDDDDEAILVENSALSNALILITCCTTCLRAFAIAIQVRLVYAKVGQSRRCQNVSETCMLVDGARGNMMQQKKWANDEN
jgi:hypothetical protein